MKREYDLVNELGPRNWLDDTAGEAVMLGCFTNDAELTMLGTQLAKSIYEIKYDEDRFYLVEAQAEALLKVIEAKKAAYDGVVFIDDCCVYRKGEKLPTEWDSDLMLAKGGYEVHRYLHQFLGEMPKGTEETEKAIKDCFRKPAFEDLNMVNESRTICGQKIDTEDYYTEKGRLVCHREIFVHECGWKQGINVIFYLEDYSQAMEIWTIITAISDRKK